MVLQVVIYWLLSWLFSLAFLFSWCSPGPYCDISIRMLGVEMQALFYKDLCSLGSTFVELLLSLNHVNPDQKETSHKYGFFPNDGCW